MLNIGRDNNDPNYRYKMPKLQTKIEGRGNGIKTVITNMVEVAKSLRVEPAYPTKFFGFELGAQSKFAAKDERAVVNGAHQAADLQKLLDKFIDVFVLCPTCRLPELGTKIKADAQKIEIVCGACGHTGVLKTAHKLATYIIKNPPSGGHSKSNAESGKTDEVAIQADAAAAAAAEGKGDKPAKEKKEKVQWFTDTSEEAQKLRQEEEFKSMQSNKAAAASAGGAAGTTGGSAAGAKASAAGVDVSAKVAEIADKKVAPGKLDDAVTVLKQYIASAKRTPDEVVSELKRLALARGFEDAKRLTTLFETLFNTADKAALATVAAQTKSAAPILKKCAGNAHDRKLLLNCVEQWVAKIEPKLLAYTPHVLQALYDADVLSEEVIVGWYDTPAEAAYLVSKDEAAAVRKRAKVFVDWLKNAEEED